MGIRSRLCNSIRSLVVNRYRDVANHYRPSEVGGARFAHPGYGPPRMSTKHSFMKSSSFIRIHRKTSGFTLVEVLVVIGIIAVLGALAMVGVRSMIAKAHESTCTGNMRQLGIAIQGFIAETGRYPTPHKDPANWDRMILPYLTDASADFTEGQFNPIRENTPEAASLGSAANILSCPANKLPPPSGQFTRSYAMCNWTENQKDSRSGGWSNGWPQLPYGEPVRPTLVSEPHRAVMMTEFWAREGKPPHIIGSNNYSVMFGFRPMPQDPDPANYHKESQHVLFVDGHVGSIPGNITQSEWNAKGYSPNKLPN